MAPALDLIFEAEHRKVPKLLFYPLKGTTSTQVRFIWESPQEKSDVNFYFLVVSFQNPKATTGFTANVGMLCVCATQKLFNVLKTLSSTILLSIIHETNVRHCSGN